MSTMVVGVIALMLIAAGLAHASKGVWFEDPSALPDVPASTEQALVGPSLQVVPTW